jgi:EAL domain-containing protein (putative c-di-GMP-specific phosphodiesterase class I)
MSSQFDAVSLAESLSDITARETIREEGSLDQVTRSLLQAIRQHLNMDVAFISEFVGDRRVFRYVDAEHDAQWMRPGDSDLREESYCQRVIDGRLPELIRDAQSQPGARDLRVTHELPVGAHLSIPIRLSNGSVFGTFCTFKREADPSLDGIHLALVRVFADVAAALIERDQEALTRDDAALSRIRRRLDAGEPVGVFQPIVNLDTRAPVGFEMLSRFPGTPTQPPDQVFADASAVGLATTLARKTVERAIDALAVLPVDCYVSVNLSPEMVLGDGFEDLLRGMPPERLVIEITEHAIVHDYRAIGNALAPIRKAGAQLAVDDAGAGYASFRHILHLHPEIIKLDMSLTRDVDTDTRRQALAAALTEFARRVGSRIVAEGVETAGELDMLRSIGPMFGQGYLFAKPQEPQAFRV